MALRNQTLLIALRELRGRIRPHGIHQLKNRLVSRDVHHNERLGDEIGQAFQYGASINLRIRDRLVSRFEIEDIVEYAQSAQDDPLPWRKQLEAPIEGGAQGSMAGRGGSTAPGQHFKPIIELRRENPKSEVIHSRGRKLDRQRVPIESATNIDDHGNVMLFHLERIGACGGALCKQSNSRKT
jgi:hypothetical protein